MRLESKKFLFDIQQAARRIAEGVERALGLGFSPLQKLAIDLTLTAAEAAYCYSVTQ
jgi:hypothetical protein